MLLLVCVPLDYSTICQSICNDQTILSIRVPGMVVDAYSRVSRRREKKRDTVNLVSQCSTLYSYLLLRVLVTCTSYTCTCTIVVVVVVSHSQTSYYGRGGQECWSRNPLRDYVLHLVWFLQKGYLYLIFCLSKTAQASEIYFANWCLPIIQRRS